jgi:hypothetical protein
MQQSFDNAKRFWEAQGVPKIGQTVLRTVIDGSAPCDSGNHQDRVDSHFGGVAGFCPNQNSVAIGDAALAELEKAAVGYKLDAETAQITLVNHELGHAVEEFTGRRVGDELVADCLTGVALKEIDPSHRNNVGILLSYMGDKDHGTGDQRILALEHGFLAPNGAEACFTLDTSTLVPIG